MMYDKIIIGVDNGSSGTIGIVRVKDGVSKGEIMLTPTKKEQNYTKKASNINRLDYNKFLEILLTNKELSDTIMIYAERPFTGMFTNTAILAARCFEAQLIAIEQAQIPYRIIDSKEWQNVMLPKGIKGSAALKKASKDLSMRLLPEYEKLIKSHGDGDGFLISVWGCKQVF